MKRPGKLVDLEQHRSERIVDDRASCAAGARANRKVALAKRSEKIRRRPLNFWRVVARPEEQQGDERGGEARCESEQQDALIKTLGIGN